MSSLLHRKPGLGKISPEWEEFEQQFPLPPVVPTPTELRKINFPTDTNPPIGFSIKQIQVPGYEGSRNQLRIYTPDEPSAARAVVIYIHGGGWTMGDLDSEDSVCRTLCKANRVAVVSVDYRKAPENPFPIGLEDVWCGVLWVFDNIESLGGRHDRVILGGLSAGGNLTSVLTQRALGNKSISFCG